MMTAETDKNNNNNNHQPWHPAHSSASLLFEKVTRLLDREASVAIFQLKGRRQSESSPMAARRLDDNDDSDDDDDADTDDSSASAFVFPDNNPD
jgi:hypothetical protein